MRFQQWWFWGNTREIVGTAGAAVRMSSYQPSPDSLVTTATRHVATLPQKSLGFTQAQEHHRHRHRKAEPGPDFPGALRTQRRYAPHLLRPYRRETSDRVQERRGHEALSRDVTAQALELETFRTLEPIQAAALSSIQNLLPLPRSDFTPTFPPMRSTAFDTMARPMPVPSYSPGGFKG